MLMLIIGMVIGGIFGMLIIALCVASKRGDRHINE